MKEKKYLEATTEKTEKGLLAIASTSNEDRVGDSLLPEDWDLANFKKNPVLQAGHDYRPQYTIGIAKNIRIEDKQLVFEPYFHTETQLARDIKAMYESNPPILKAWSVGFIPYALMTDSKGNKMGKNELLEVSAVAVPANAEALTIAKNYDDTTVGKIKQWVEKTVEPSETEAETVIEETEIKPEETTEEIKPVDEETRIDTEEKKKKQEECRLDSETMTDCIERLLPDLVDNGLTEEDATTEAKKLCSTMCSAKGKKATEKSPACRMTDETKEQCVSRKIPELIRDDGMTQEQAVAAAENICSKKCKEVEEVELKSVVPYKNHGAAPIDESWDGGAEIKACGDDTNKLKSICTWYDSSNADVKSSYKLPHHHASDLKEVWSGVSAAMGALLGARGGVNIPESDRKGVYNHLSKHYTEFEKTPPDFKEYSIGELLELHENKFITLEEIEVKEGRVLSKKNRSLVTTVVESMKTTITALEELLSATEPSQNGGKSSDAPVKAQGSIDKSREPEEVKVLNDKSKDEIVNLVVLQALQKISGYSAKALHQIKK